MGWKILGPIYMYKQLMIVPIPVLENWLWKLKLPLKIKIFLWHLGRGVTLTKDNLIKKIGMVVQNVPFAIIMKQRHH